MVNNKKVQLMTQIALYEKREKNKSLLVNRFFRGDYLVVRMLRALLFFTIIYIIVIGMWLVYRGQDLLSANDLGKIIEIIKYAIVGYLFSLIPFLSVVYLSFWIRYTKSRRKIKKYQKNLKSLKLWYQSEEK
ncbi:hypothetical protein P261_01744 [Lachnospiraceae bacterium TWA4]|nr:hypothetical protein P261_01744 [Lachnospiraceae bacterium TWA4]